MPALFLVRTGLMTTFDKRQSITCLLCVCAGVSLFIQILGVSKLSLFFESSDVWVDVEDTSVDEYQTMCCGK